MRTEWFAIIKDNQNTNYEIREHISYCFNCLTKVLPIEQQVALILKDIYDFKVNEIGLIIGKTLGSTKHLLYNARQKMQDIFQHDCALVNKGGICYKCSELNQVFNPKQKEQEELQKIALSKEGDNSKAELYELRKKLVSALDPFEEKGLEIHEFMYKLNEQAQNN